MKKKIVVFILTFCMMMFGSVALADQEKVVGLGANLNDSQRTEMLEKFGVSKDEARIIEVTNDEEREYLKGLISEDKIGTRAISSVYIETLGKGAGISVETYNINWVTKEMYANAMATAGIEDAKVMAAAPFKVSGTAALTGIMKAFETATGKKLSDEAKKAASEELVLTGELGEEVGKDEAAALIKDVKEKVVKDKVTDPGEITIIIKNAAKELNIKLDKDQINQIMEVMKKISQLDLNIDKISSQLDKISSSLDDVRRTVEENKGLIQKILDAIVSFFKKIGALFS